MVAAMLVCHEHKGLVAEENPTACKKRLDSTSSVWARGPGRRGVVLTVEINNNRGYSSAKAAISVLLPVFFLLFFMNPTAMPRI